MGVGIGDGVMGAGIGAGDGAGAGCRLGAGAGVCPVGGVGIAGTFVLGWVVETCVLSATVSSVSEALMRG
jgi:hypothetical protein